MAHSAVSAAEDVRSTVRAARTACNAKDAAISAAHMAQSVCENGKFATINEARAAETRASIAKSHAIHAAVVEHEAKTAKRRSTLALAHDVKCWNVHRKREVLKICLAHAKSQHEATRRAVDAWSCLRDGFVGSAIIPITQSWKPTKINLVLVNDQPEVETTIFGNSDKANKEHNSIVAVEHKNLKLPMESLIPKSQSIGDMNLSYLHEKTDPVVPLVIRSPISEEVEDTPNNRDPLSFVHESRLMEHQQIEEADYDAHHNLSCDSHLPSKTIVPKLAAKSEKERSDESSVKENDEALTSSMQSLVDGLMNWGGIEIEDNFALPTGMAASIALEESAAFGSNP